MAKKGQVQLQAELTNEDEWEKFLQRDGLLLVDVYSEWCGPCLGMSANLKKLKLEVGGDMLQLAMAKSDNIEQLERFRNKSEPTWMFISKRKMVYLMFGADAPKLTRLILEELKKEKQSISGERPREVLMEITDLTEEEQERVEAIESVKRAAKAREDAKMAKALYERRTAECKSLLTTLANLGTILIFPIAKDKYKDVLTELIQEAGLDIQQTEKVNITQEKLDELLYFADDPHEEIDEDSVQELLDNQSIVLLVHPAHGSEIPDVGDAILSVVYGPMKKPPGSPDSPAQILYLSRGDDEEEEGDEPAELMGIWAPVKPFMRAVSVKIFFRKIAADCILPDPEPTPDHMAIIFDQRKVNDALQVMHEYPNEILKYGFFTNEIPGEAELVARTVRKLEKCEKRTYTEKLVLEVAKRKSECVFAFAQLGPLYISPNAEEGKRECLLFFPDSDVESLDEESEEEEDEGEAAEVFKMAEPQQTEEPEEIEPSMTDEGATEDEEEGEEGDDISMLMDTPPPESVEPPPAEEA